MNLKNKRIINAVNNQVSSNKAPKKVLKKLGLIVVLIVTLTAMCGLYDVKKVEHSAYVIAMGIDKGEKDNIVLTMQVIPPNILTVESAGNQENKLYTTSVAANSIEEAIALAHGYVSTVLNFAHMRAVVFSEEIAKEGIIDYITSLSNNPMYDTNMNIFVSKCKASLFLENVSPVLEVNPLLYYDILNHSKNTAGTTEEMTLIQFIENLYSDTTSPVATLCNVTSDVLEKEQKKNEQKTSNKDSSTETSSKEEEESASKEESNKSGNNVPQNSSNNLNKVKENNSFDFIAGEIPQQSNSKTEIFGTALFKDDKFVGELTGKETSYYLMLHGKLTSMYFDIDLGDVNMTNNATDQNAPESGSNNKNSNNIQNRDFDSDSDNTSKNLYHIYVKQQRPPSIKVELQNDIPKISIDLYLNTTVIGTENYSYNYSNLENLNVATKKVKDYLSSELHNYLDKITKDHKIDIHNFGKYTKSKFLTTKAFNEFDWNSKLPNAQYSINITLYPANPGLSRHK